MGLQQSSQGISNCEVVVYNKNRCGTLNSHLISTASVFDESNAISARDIAKYVMILTLVPLIPKL
jgi:hypothetical protein